MPSFLHDASAIHDNTDILNFDLHSHLTSQHHKLDAASFDISHHQHRQSNIHEPFDEASNSSIHDSDVSESNPMTLNGNITRPTSMGSLSNSKNTNSSSTLRQDERDDRRNLPNGLNMTLPDRTAPRLARSGANETTSYPGQWTSRPSVEETSVTQSTSTNAHTTIETQQLHDTALPLQTIPSETEPANLQPVHTNSFPTSISTPTKTTSHRLSSPTAAPQSSASNNTASTGHLHPPQTSSTLRQRHNLEVPKAPPASGRPSRDGMDTAQASGRFSPVAASGGRRASLSLARRTTRSMQSEAPRDEVVPDEDVQRWADAYRQKRASKRKRKVDEDEDRVLVGTKVDESHANWVTAYNMLTGIRVSVSRTNAKLDRELNDMDFQVKQKSTFDIAGNELVPSAKYDFKFKDYAPWVFRHLRALFRLDPADYLMSLTGKYILSELGSPGKSGSFFYFSRDYKYIIKTIHHAEHKFLRKILREYYDHVKDNPNTLLSQFYGLHRVKLPYGKKIHFVVMNNLFPPHRDIHMTFDLKGSTLGRNYEEGDLEANPRATLKDLNWLRRQRNLEFGLQKKRLFLEQLQRDVVLLKRLQIMDYSLLVGIHDSKRGNEENLRDKTLQVFNPGGEKAPDDEPVSVLLRTPSTMENARKARELRQMIRAERPVPIGQALDKMPDELEEGQGRPGFVFNQDDGGFRATHEDDSPADEIYYLGVIDCLTHYGMIKKIEHFWKGLTNDRTQISALPPLQYGDRFYNFIQGNTMSAEEARREAARAQEQAVTQNLESSLRGRNSQQGIPPMPNHEPPAPPPGGLSPEGRETVERAKKAAQQESDGERPPERVLKTATAASGEKRDSLQHEPILPVVQEADPEHSYYRAKSPTRDKVLPPTRCPPPTPPKGADGGYGHMRNDSSGTMNERTRMSRESLRNKMLPPLPRLQDGPNGAAIQGQGQSQGQQNGIRVVME